MSDSRLGRPRPKTWRRLRIVVRRLRRWYRGVEFTLAKRFGLATREDRVFFLLIGAVGVLAGVLGVAVQRLIDGLRHLLWRDPGSLVAAALALPRWWLVMAPVVGGALVGLVIWLGRQPVAGKGMGMLIESVALRGGRVPARPVILRALAGIATVGSGGALGREGPMIRLGAMIASQLGLRFGLAPHRVKVLVGCGAAAGLAAAYNIPVGGALFAMEIILGNFALEIFGPVVVSSVISTLIARAAQGDLPSYPGPAYSLVSGWEILAYAGLGLVAAVASIGFTLGVRAGGRLFSRLTFLPQPLRPILGMALLGLLALVTPHALGSGYETSQWALTGGLPLTLLVALPVVRLVATALTAGSGCAGGLFSPSIAIGALVGGLYGYGINSIWPDLTAPYGAYALVGMAAIVAGSSHAPISAILILFEFTGNYNLILPLMLSAIIASWAARRLYPYSVYTEALERQGIDVAFRMEEAVLAGLRVKDLVRQDADVLHPGDDYRRVVERFLATRRQRLYVVDEGGRLVGAVSLHDIKHALSDPDTLSAVVAHDLMLPVDHVLQEEERLHRAAAVFASSDNERLPVVDGPAGKFCGLLAKRDLLAIYAQEVLGRPALLATFVSSDSGEAGRDYVELPPDFTVRLVPVPDALVGKTLEDARLPQTVRGTVLEIKRHGPYGDQRIIPEAATVLKRGDDLIVLGPTRELEALARGELPVDEAGAHREID